MRICQLRLTDTMPAIRFDGSQHAPTLTIHTSQQGKRMKLFVGEDHASVWAEQGGVSVKLPAEVVEGIADEATRRHPIGLSQPHWAKIAQEWVFRGHINLEELADVTLLSAVDNLDKKMDMQQAS